MRWVVNEVHVGAQQHGMISPALERRLAEALSHGADRAPYPLLMGAVAFIATLSMTVPFGPLLTLGVLLAPRRWKAVAFVSSCGAALAAALLYLFFHHLGWVQLSERYPEIARSQAWSDAQLWLSAYGVAALFVIAASPLPQTPALMFAAMHALPLPQVVLALMLGKLIKYSTYAWLAACFPKPFHERLRRDRGAIAHALDAFSRGLPP